MIVVTVELWPGGSESAKRHLGTATITNDATGTLTRSNYKVVLSKRGQPGSVWKRSHVINFPRKLLGHWDLLMCGLAAICGPRTKETGIQAKEV